MRTNYISKMIVALCMLLSSVGLSAVDFWVTPEGSDDPMRFISHEDTTTVYLKAVDNSASGEVCVPSTVTKDNVTYTVIAIGQWSCSGKTEVTSVILPETIDTIALGAFKGCTKLASITIPAVQVMGNEVLSGCGLLEELILPEGLTTMGASIAVDCYSLKKVVLPATLTKVGACAFMDCLSLREIHLASETPQPIDVLWDTFKCESSTVKGDDGTINTQFLQDSCLIFVPKAAAVSAYKANESVWKNYFKYFTYEGVPIPEFSVWTDVGWFKSTESIDDDPLNLYLHQVVNGLTGDVVIPATFKQLRYEYKVVELKSHVFRYRSEKAPITSVTMPSTLKVIGEHAFYECSEIEVITLNEGLDSIAKNAFAKCSGLTEMRFPEGLRVLGDGACSGCSNLSKVYLPSTLNVCQRWSFNDCVKLTEIHIAKSDTVVEVPNLWDTFKCETSNPDNKDILSDQCTIYVPENLLDEYKNNSMWKNFFKNFVGVGVSTSIGSASDTQLSAYAQDESIVVRFAPVGELVEVYNLSGVRVASQVVTGATTAIDVTRGIYIIKAGSEVLKVVK